MRPPAIGCCGSESHLYDAEVLTYMSIRDEIKARVDEGRLLHLPHSLPGAPTARTLFVSEEVGNVVIGPWSHDTDMIPKDCALPSFAHISTCSVRAVSSR